jgi:hypothetical protein
MIFFVVLMGSLTAGPGEDAPIDRLVFTDDPYYYTYAYTTLRSAEAVEAMDLSKGQVSDIGKILNGWRSKRFNISKQTKEEHPGRLSSEKAMKEYSKAIRLRSRKSNVDFDREIQKIVLPPQHDEFKRRLLFRFAKFQPPILDEALLRALILSPDQRKAVTSLTKEYREVREVLKNFDGEEAVLKKLHGRLAVRLESRLAQILTEENVADMKEILGDYYKPLRKSKEESLWVVQRPPVRPNASVPGYGTTKSGGFGSSRK